MKLKKNVKLLAATVIIILAAIAFINNVNFKSVSTYRQEQEKLADSETVTDQDGNAQIIFEDGDSVSKGQVKDSIKKQLKARETEQEDTKKDAVQKSETDSQNTATKEAVPKNTETVNQDSDKSATETSKYSQNLEDKENARKKDLSDNNSKTAGDKRAAKKDDKSDTDTEKNNSENNTENCSISINCKELSSNPEKMASQYRTYIPENGIILEAENVKVLEGTTVYDILAAACKKDGIAIDADYDMFYDSYYVSSICNLPEKAGGEMSGWVYTINGKSPMVGASSYQVGDGDNIVWFYTVDGIM